MSEISVENLYYLGPDGSNTYNAMLSFCNKYNIKYNNRLPQRSIKAALSALEHDFSSICVLPVENSIEGIVRETIDNFLRFEDNTIQVLGELTLPINHMLLSKAKNKKDIIKVYSHPQALTQCNNYLYKNLPEAELREVSSTSYAAEKVSKEGYENSAAIANASCAELFGLNILDYNINDETGNETRFYLLGRNEAAKSDNGKTAIMVATQNKAGALCEVLQILSKHNINLTCIDSRPSRKKMGEYMFFMELDGLKDDLRIKSAFEELMRTVEFIKILGSFQSEQ